LTSAAAPNHTYRHDQTLPGAPLDTSLVFKHQSRLERLGARNFALRQQRFRVIWRATSRRTRDRLFWMSLGNWRQALKLIVKPETVVGWHRQGFKFFWTEISRRKKRRSASRQSTKSETLIKQDG